MATADDDIPIDPALLNEGPSQYRTVPSSNNGDDQAFDEDDYGDEGGSDDEEADDIEQNIRDDSSGIEDNDEDAYVEEEEDEDDSEDARGAGEEPEEDTIFNRLAGNVSKAGQRGEINVNELDIEGELAKADNDQLLGKPMTRRQTRAANRKQHKPSYNVQILVGRANMAYTNGDTKQTITLYAEVIRHDPYVIAAWNTLASVYEEEGNEEGARQMRFFAAHVEDEGDTWKDLARQFRQSGKIDQCTYCLRKALSKDGSDVGVLFELASIYRMTGNTKKMVDAFKKILRLQGPWAHEFTFLQQFRPSMVAAYRKIIAGAYKVAFDWHVSRCGPEDSGSTMNLRHVIHLVDDLIELEQLEEAVNIIRRGQRWLQDRRHQTKWDEMEDDREYDPPDYTRDDVKKDTRKKAQKEGGGEDLGEDDDEADDGEDSHPLETPLRHRLAVLRLRLGDDKEAEIHMEELLTLNTEQNDVVFEDLGRMLVKREKWAKACECLSRINECEEVDDKPELIYLLAICQHKLGQNNAALDGLNWVLDQQPDFADARYLQIKILEDKGEKDKALELVTQFIQEQASVGRPDRPPARSHKKKTRAEEAGDRKLTRAALEMQMKDQMQLLWNAAQTAEAEIGEGKAGALDAFIQSAGTMVENFRLSKTNYSKNRHPFAMRQIKNDLTAQARILQDRLERAMGVEETVTGEAADDKYVIKRMNDFYGIGREEWLQLVVKYCAVLMVKQEADVAMEILEHVVQAALFNTRRCEVALRMITIACAMRTQEYLKIVDNCKRLAQMHQFRVEPFLLLLNCLSHGGTKAHLAFQNGPLQKFLHRELTIHEALVKGQQATYSERNSRWNPVIKIGVSRRLGDQALYNDEKRRNDDDEDGDENGGAHNDDDEEEPEDEIIDEVEGSEGGEMNEDAWTFNVPRPTSHIPHYNALYGLYMLSSKAYQSALFYLFRAYEMVPYDPLICLAIAQAYFGRCMNRQSDNRNYQITQGLAFLTKYKKYSRKDPKSVEEVEYNYGRVFHGLGVPHLAIEHYERVIASVQNRMAEVDEGYSHEVMADSLVYEAVHNLMQLYMATGNIPMVKKLSVWLAI